MTKLFRNAKEAAQFLGYSDMQDFEIARQAGMVPAPDTVFCQMPYWSLGTLEVVTQKAEEVIE